MKYAIFRSVADPEKGAVMNVTEFVNYPLMKASLSEAEIEVNAEDPVYTEAIMRPGEIFRLSDQSVLVRLNG